MWWHCLRAPVPVAIRRLPIIRMLALSRICVTPPSYRPRCYPATPLLRSRGPSGPALSPAPRISRALSHISPRGLAFGRSPSSSGGSRAFPGAHASGITSRAIPPLSPTDIFPGRALRILRAHPVLRPIGRQEKYNRAQYKTESEARSHITGTDGLCLPSRVPSPVPSPGSVARSIRLSSPSLAPGPN